VIPAQAGIQASLHPPPVSLPRKRQSRTTLDSLGPASYPAALKQAPSSLHCSSRRSVTSAASFGYTVPLRPTGHGRFSAHGSSTHGSAGFFRAVWINQETMWRRPLGEETPIFSTISHQRADDVAQALGRGNADFFDHFASTSRRCAVGRWREGPIFFDHFESKWKIFALALTGAWSGRKRALAAKKT